MKKASAFEKRKLSAFEKWTALELVWDSTKSIAEFPNKFFKLVGSIRSQNGRKGTGFAGLEQVFAGNDGCNFYAFSNV